MVNPKQVLERVIRPVLSTLGLGSPAAEQLLLGTMAQESLMGLYIKQVSGPALGIYQMEPTTHDDIWENFLAYRPGLADIVRSFAGSFNGPSAVEMVGNYNYATAMARVHYFRVPDPLPAFDDIEAQAKYWKVHYNTVNGAGSPWQYTRKYDQYVGYTLWN